ncbi:ImmA/IrrE family metallo-endopeptidase [Pyruvatibacter sp.]|uniref:ImmA/IrrE family metallo-endopeptidase n=1 Tax=Pyruvatibacter sp. TaxID=1981328 RepID=UPI003267405A
MAHSKDRAAILRGMTAAMKLHRDLGTKDRLDPTARVDVYGAIARTGAVLMFKPLNPLLGAFMREGDTRGIVITLQRPSGVQRFTASHELGHLIMEHEPNADGDDILRRGPLESSASSVPIQEREADAFASHFLLPKFALSKLLRQQQWTREDLRNPHCLYQAALRLGASYEATVRAFERDKLLGRQERVALLSIRPRDIKVELVDEHQPSNWQNRDVWRLTEKDADTVIEAGRNDLFVLKLREHRGSGYLWTFEELKKAGFVILKDEVDAIYPDRVGGSKRRWVLGDTSALQEGTYNIEHIRPWGEKEAAETLRLRYQHSPGREDGLYWNQTSQALGAG